MRGHEHIRGSAMVIAALVVFTLMAFSAAFLATNQVRSVDAASAADLERAQRLAEAGIGVKISKMVEGGDTPDLAELSHYYAADDAANPLQAEAGYVVQVVQSSTDPNLYILGSIAQIGESGSGSEVRRMLVTVWRKLVPQVPAQAGAVDALLPEGVVMGAGDFRAGGTSHTDGRDTAAIGSRNRPSTSDDKPAIFVSGDPANVAVFQANLPKGAEKKEPAGVRKQGRGGGGSSGGGSSSGGGTGENEPLIGGNGTGGTLIGDGAIQGGDPSADPDAPTREGFEAFFDAVDGALDANPDLGWTIVADDINDGNLNSGLLDDLGITSMGTWNATDPASGLKIIHLIGDWRINGNVQLNGIIIVDGSLDFNGSPQINGMIYINGPLTFSQGTPDIRGGVQVLLPDPDLDTNGDGVPDGYAGEVFKVNGNFDLHYSQEVADAVQSFLTNLPVTYRPKVWVNQEEASGASGSVINRDAPLIRPDLEAALDSLMGR